MRWFSPCTPVSSTNKTECHDITEILFKVALSTITIFNGMWFFFLLQRIKFVPKFLVWFCEEFFFSLLTEVNSASSYIFSMVAGLFKIIFLFFSYFLCAIQFYLLSFQINCQINKTGWTCTLPIPPHKLLPLPFVFLMYCLSYMWN